MAHGERRRTRGGHNGAVAQQRFAFFGILY